ncbi:MAG TPA: RNA 2',3'-cyclic phosphodiesterase, partial [Thermoanaerobaculia bacterium]|nr:RNA 2',3'-cyclic phosphodiesterase [Thermoanaerobaculia bacterium]
AVEGEEAGARLRALLSQLREVRGLRAVPHQQIHFTLKFFEDLPADRVAAAKSAAARAAAAASPFSLNLSGLGTFPSRGPARVLWVGCGAGADALSGLASAVEREFSLEGFLPEPRPFSPHLTLARVKDPRAGRDAAAFVSANATFDGGAVEVKELILYQSVLGPSGAAHTPLGRFPLVPR